MADETTDRAKDPERRPGAVGGGPALADEGDVAFGGMAGIGVLAAVIVSMLGLAGFFGYSTMNDEPTETTVVHEEPEEVDEDVEEVDEEEAAAAAAAAAAAEAERQAAEDARAEAAATPVAAFAQASVDGIILSGTVPSQQVADEIRAAGSTVYSDEQIDDRLEIDEAAVRYTLTATGELASQTDLDALAGAFSTLPEVEFTNELGVSAGAAVVDQLNQLFALEPIQFESGTDVVTPASQPTLDRAAEILVGFPDGSIEVGGHTDSRGDDAANQQLSEARAQRVVTELQARGVQTDLTAVGYGETQLLVNPDDTPEAQQQNRRIEFKVLSEG